MRIIKILSAWITSVILHICLLLVFLSSVMLFSLSRPEIYKETLSETNAYQDFVSSVIESNLEAAQESSTSIPLDDLMIQKIVYSIFSPEMLQKKTETVIDQTFAWLRSDVNRLQLFVDFTQERNELYDRLSQYAAERTAGLDECAPDEILNQTNVFELSCRPFGFSKEIVATSVRNDLENSNFLKDTVFTEVDLPKTASGEYFYETYSFLPQVFSLLTKLPVFVAISILAMIPFVLVRTLGRKGFRRLSRYLFSSATTILFATVLFGYIIPHYTSAFEIKGNATAELQNKIANTFISKVDIVVIKTAFSILLVAALITFVERVTRKRMNYKDAEVQAGVISSLEKRQAQTGKVDKKKLPPVQTSEEQKSKKAKKTNKKINKYRKIQL